MIFTECDANANNYITCNGLRIERDFARDIHTLKHEHIKPIPIWMPYSLRVNFFSTIELRAI